MNRTTNPVKARSVKHVRWRSRFVHLNPVSARSARPSHQNRMIVWTA